MDTEQALVNGNLMKKYVGKSVRLYLKVENVSSGGRQVIEKYCEILIVVIVLKLLTLIMKKTIHYNDSY